MIGVLSDFRFDINYQDDMDNTAFMHAAENGHRDVIRMMLFDLPHAYLYLGNDYNQHTVFYEAISNGHDDLVELFMSAMIFDINRTSTQGFTPLHVAVSEDKDALVERLLSLKADPNVPDEEGGETPLIMCMRERCSVSVLLKLLEGGADPNKPNDLTGCRPLMLAAKTGDLEACDALLGAGADIDCKHPHDGLTALEVAVGADSMKVAVLLLRRGASKMDSLDGEDVKNLMAWLEEDHEELEYQLHLKEEQLLQDSQYLSEQVEAWCEGVVDRERRRNPTCTRERRLQRVPAE